MGIDRRLGTVLLRATGVFLLAMATIALVAPRRPNTTYSTPRVLACLAVLAALTALVRLGRARLRLGAGREVPRWAGPALAVVPAVGCTLLAYALRYRFGWDAGAVLSISERIADGRELTGIQYGYLSRYPNTLPLLVVDNQLQRVSGWTHLHAATLFVGLNGLALAVTLLGTYWLVSMLRGRGAGLAAELLVLALVGLSPWMTIGYTDLIAMPWLVLGLALVVRLGRTGSRPRQALLAVLAVCCLWLAFTLKTTPVVAFAAVALLTAGAALPRSAARRPLAAALAGGLVLFLGLTLVSRQALPDLAEVGSQRVDRSQSLSPVLWMAMGVTTTRTGSGRVQYGGYDPVAGDMVDILEGPELRAWAERRLRDRLSELGPGGYLRFVVDKSAWNWGDGMFWAWGEGHDREERNLGQGRLAEVVDRWNRPDGAGYPWRADAAQAVWLFLLLLLGARALRARWTWQTGLLLLCVLGIAAFTVIFEGRSRYLLVHVPVVVALALSLPPVLPGRRTGRSDGARRAEAARPGQGGDQTADEGVAETDGGRLGSVQ